MAYQSPAVTGQVSLTCDVWQASNTDGYFAVTGHWIEESVAGEWCNGLAPFVRLGPLKPLKSTKYQRQTQRRQC